MPNIPANHLKFIELVARGLSKTDAYRQGLGKSEASIKTANEQGSKLARKYTHAIQEARKKQKAYIDKANEDKAVKIELSKIATQAQVDAKAFRILTDDDEVDDEYLVNWVPTPYKRKPTQTEIQKATALYNARFGSNAPIKTDNKTEFILPPLFPDVKPDEIT